VAAASAYSSLTPWDGRREWLNESHRTSISRAASLFPSGSCRPRPTTTGDAPMLTLFFEQLTEQFPYFLFCGSECSPAAPRGTVNTPKTATDKLFLRTQPFPGFEFVQYGIKGPGADVIAVARELVDHLQAEYGAFAGMVQDM